MLICAENRAFDAVLNGRKYNETATNDILKKACENASQATRRDYKPEDIAKEANETVTTELEKYNVSLKEERDRMNASSEVKHYNEMTAEQRLEHAVSNRHVVDGYAPISMNDPDELESENKSVEGENKSVESENKELENPQVNI